MARLTDIIEDFLNELLDDNSGAVELKRNELALHFNCSPSQINYVLETRFQPSMGYYIESRRGGGGYIKIERVEFDLNEEFETLITETIGDSITMNTIDSILDALAQANIITKRESKIIQASVEDRALMVKPEDRNRERASIFRNILLVVAKEDGYEI
ncbi:MAG: CtsR family transcriptional regulator [Ezakiella sp.]|nr:CtsR family transcriptional regulator [Ezakiella sp.]MDD7761551.1 CtsR family transcriptional regulator [Bacillota bacterium]MDY3946856.1 CtsR family transcriptional regulator [Ezakiella sp.]